MEIYIGATRQNDGKTIVSLGLLKAFKKKGKKIGYMKPVGQQYRLIDGKMIDKDVVLMRDIFDLKDELSSMSPIAIPKGFTEDYIMHSNKEALVKKIINGYKNVSREKEFLLIEGTGHAGVGSVFNMSNSDVVKLLGPKVIIVSLGGIGRPIDEIMLNRAKFDEKNIQVVGAIINKVRPDKYDKIDKLVRKGLEREGIEVLGVIPHEDVLSNPSVAQLLEDLKGELLSGQDGLHNIVARFIIGDMLPHVALDSFTGNTLLIIPGNREELILTALSGYILGTTKVPLISGIIFTCGIHPHEKIMDLLKRTNIPLILVQEDSFAIATEINNMIFKIRSDDTEKIYAIETLIEKYVDIERIAQLS
jgi:phosphate acetyltransferase